MFLSGQVGLRPDGTLPQSVVEQADQVFANIGALLARTGSMPAHSSSSPCSLSRDGISKRCERPECKFMGAHRPASTAVFVAQLADPAWHVEVEAIAAKARNVGPRAGPRVGEPVMKPRGALTAAVVVAVLGAACGREALQPGEGFVSVPGGRVWYRVVGSGPRTPLLLVHGGPGREVVTFPLSPSSLTSVRSSSTISWAADGPITHRIRRCGESTDSSTNWPCCAPR